MSNQISKIAIRFLTVFTRNLQVVYDKIPEGFPDPERTFRINEGAIKLDGVELGDSEILLRTLWISVDPYLRNLMRDPLIDSYLPAFVPGEVLWGGVVGQVVESKDEEYEKGDVVVVFSTWEEYAIVNTKREGLAGQIQKIPDAGRSSVPLSYYLGVLGYLGITAYTGLHKICEPLSPGQTLFVSAAAGGVGHIVGQYGKSLGLRVVGSTGSDEKVKFLLNDLNFDGAFNYKTADDLESTLNRMCPDGIDIYFENVGGRMLDAVLANANNFARIAVCGMVSQYNKKCGEKELVYRMDSLIWKRIRMEGFLAADGMEVYAKPAVTALLKLVQEGKVIYKETVTEGIENTPVAFVEMLKGKNLGKAVVKVDEME